jgi:hypothetical protein
MAARLAASKAMKDRSPDRDQTMRSQRLPDCRPPRRDDSITSASSHPELLIGEIAIRPRVNLARADREAIASWNRRILAVCALVAAVVAGYSMINPGTTAVAPDARQHAAEPG